MADVRALLRAEKASRAAAQTPAKPPAGKKRKAVESPEIDRKRSRTEAASNLPAGFFDGGAGEGEVEDDDTEDQPLVSPPLETPHEATPDIPATPPADDEVPELPPAAAEAVDEAEWAAFERDVINAPDIVAQEQSAFKSASAVIEAAPVSAAELAAQAKNQDSNQRAAREAELEAEKEDATRYLEEEFETMEALEDRVRRLKEQREALRRGSVSVPTEDKGIITTQQPTPRAENESEEEEEEDDDDEDDDDDIDEWKFGRE